MSKWYKYKKNNENKQNNNGLPTVNINWEITTYGKLPRKAYK